MIVKEPLRFIRDAFALAAFDGLEIQIFIVPSWRASCFRRLFQTRRAADVERAHCELRARLADGLRGNTPTASPISTGRPVARLRP